jgi:PAS domain S-box-containing protein
MPIRSLSGLQPQQLIIAALLVLAVSVFRQLALASWSPSLSFSLFYPVLLFCTWLGGFRLGVFVTALSVFSLTIFLWYHPAIEPGRFGALFGTLVVEGFAVSYLFDRLRKAVQSSVEHRLHLMKVFVNEAPAAIAMFDNDMRYLAASKRWYSDYNIAGDSIVGKSHYDIFPEIPERWRQIHQRCLSGATERAEEDLFERADGTKQWIRWEVKPWMSDESPPRIGGIVMFSEDITGLKKAHERVVAAAAQSAIDTARYVEAEAMSVGKDEFLATLSHELRSPLHALLGWVHVLKRSGNDLQLLPQALAAIESSVQTLSQLIADLLDVTRIISGKLRLDIKRVSVAELLKEAVGVAFPQAAAREVRLQLRECAPEIFVRGDPVRLQQCVSNLLSNAIKFTPSGGSVVVSAASLNDIVQIAVLDTGKGIRSDALPHIFERYAQTSAASTRVHGGLGLGLSIVKHLVSLHGGTITASSAGPGLGSTFTISLPLAPAKEQQPGVSRLSEFVDKPTLLKDLTFLVVDDDVEMRELLRTLLEDRGAVVKIASNADEAGAIAHTTKLSLILSDLSMPGRDGCDFIQELRSSKIAVPAIVLTGSGTPAEIERALKAGFNEHLLKPVGAEELLDTIVRVLGPKQQQLVGNE